MFLWPKSLVVVEAIDLIYPVKLPVAEKRLPAFERLQAALVIGGQARVVPRLVVTGLGPGGELLEAQPIFGHELFNLGLTQMIGGYGGHCLLVAVGVQASLEPMGLLLDSLAVQAFHLVQSRRAGDGREQLLEQLRSELFLKVPNAGPLDLLRTEEVIGRCWRELLNHREAFGRLRSDLQHDLQRALQSGPTPQWTWRITLLNGRLRARQVATR
ncbi:gll3315 [Gloeobacter violaceus PCC 7421]|uniref:Gll3315 protein n=1 Tax=Gloeobacter violaceus (strain ATCC 29082 / PCC 7421) TaxID=251221 RepID=Q7NG58_GLOVI|nr:gll3315 [Gloeobacter violaceus PCC 7421]